MDAGGPSKKTRAAVRNQRRRARGSTKHNVLPPQCQHGLSAVPSPSVFGLHRLQKRFFGKDLTFGIQYVIVFVKLIFVRFWRRMRTRTSDRCDTRPASSNACILPIFLPTQGSVRLLFLLMSARRRSCACGRPFFRPLTIGSYVPFPRADLS